MKKLILGSKSPRRKQLLEELHIPFDVRVGKFNEDTVTIDDPMRKAEHLAYLKAKNIPLKSNEEIILTADTIVSFKNTIFGKPKNKDEAFTMIKSLSGNTHNVITAVTLRSVEKEIVFSVKTEVEFWPLSIGQIKSYTLTKEPYDKAGAYGIQGLARLFIKRINGDYYNVVGLPISYVMQELFKFGFKMNKFEE